ncbi:coproporphyrinogen dehydrogenase HemZ [Papillibacter cinnamivorans]|uniref:Oxygen-independent coproporphyrinogen-3 oxidase n=1 Tax=Papillibacter cinnamivorans DSM 12816 TaxID=1122930 RepID=A0A1W2A1S7_9FIRM|nr:coproporphyrinogen dehydrogenase HemZ [Papillibacter cinnamivorans]SMC54614.1 oxygen-independent coproporphyrinogen-3 oxidase [Papillibacter cinnamivorans DSM 12816]
MTHLQYGGERYEGRARIPVSRLTGKLETDRLLQQTIKRSFFRAACRATGQTPPWGSLTGIRPAKIVTRIFDGGGDRAAAEGILREVYSVTADRRRLCIDAAEAGLKARRDLGEREISLYVGIPFCPTRCAYCSFVSHSTEKSFRLVEPYLAALEEEIRRAGELVRQGGYRVSTVYIGGGTPTTLSAEQLERLLGRLSDSFDLSGLREYTVEAGRPDTITEEKLRALKAGGADRISINPQTMDDRVLAAIGRNHSTKQTGDAFLLARKAGFEKINMDLIAGLPQDSTEGFRDSLTRVLDMRPENITVHTLSLKKGSRLMLEGGNLPSAGEVEAMLDFASFRLRAAGFFPYYLYRQKFMSGNFENVGWTRPGFEGLYNIYIMEELQTILALGGGGTTKLVDPKSGRIERIFNPKYPYEYIAGIEAVLRNKARFLDFPQPAARS